MYSSAVSWSQRLKIGIKSSDFEYTVSKDLLCKESAYFSAMFEGGFKEGQQLKAVLEDIEGVASVQSLEGFLKWLYVRTINFDLDQPEDQISAAIELAWFADMCCVAGMESHIAQYLKEILLTNPKPYRLNYGIYINTYCLTSQHLVSATLLPQGHAVRRILASAMVERCFRWKNDVLLEETQENLSFRADLLGEVRRTLMGLNFQGVATYKDALDGTENIIDHF